MKQSVRASLLIAFALALCAPASALPPEAPWFVGFWTMTHDEDGTPPDTMEFRADGTYINYGYRCSGVAKTKYHVYAGDIYVTFEVEGKGPIAIVFRQNSDRTQLTFTSPRSRKNATYARLRTNPCQSG